MKKKIPDPGFLSCKALYPEFFVFQLWVDSEVEILKLFTHAVSVTHKASKPFSWSWKASRLISLKLYTSWGTVKALLNKK